MDTSAHQDFDEAFYQFVDDAIGALSRDLSEYARGLRKCSEIAENRSRSKLLQWSNEALHSAQCVQIIVSATNTDSPGRHSIEGDVRAIGIELRAFADELLPGSPVLRAQLIARLRDWGTRAATSAAQAASLYAAVELSYFGPDTASPVKPFRHGSPFVVAAQSRTIWKAIGELRATRSAGDLKASANQRDVLERYARRSCLAALRTACRRAWFADTELNGPLESVSIWGDGDIECDEYGTVYGRLRA